MAISFAQAEKPKCHRAELHFEKPTRKPVLFPNGDRVMLARSRVQLNIGTGRLFVRQRFARLDGLALALAPALALPHPIRLTTKLSVVCKLSVTTSVSIEHSLSATA